MVERLQRYTPWVFVVALALYLHPYTGIRHDAILYLGQALNVLQPSVFSSDLFFAGGSQADYTAFPWLISNLLAHATPGTAFLWLTVLGRMVFLAGSWFFLRAVMPARWVLPALLALVAMPTRYGGFGIFAYNESFLTPRLFAEPAVLVGLALLVRGRYISAVITFSAAFLLHPLQAITGALVAWCWLVAADRRWLLAIVAAPLAVLLGFLDVPLLSGLVRRIDNDWWQVIQSFSSQTILGTWPPRDWAIVVTDFFLLHLTSRYEGNPRLQRIARVIMAAGLISLGFSFVCGDLLRLQLPLSIQLWRTLWIVHWLAMASLPMLLVQAWKSEQHPKVAFAVLLGIALLGASIRNIPLPLLALPLIVFHIFWQQLCPHVSRPFQKLIVAAVAIFVLGAFTRYAINSFAVFELFGSDLNKVRQDVVLIGYPAVTVALVSFAAYLYKSPGKMRHIALAAGSLSLLLLSIAAFDSRSGWNRLVESRAEGAVVLAKHIEAGASVYWPSVEESPLAPWLALGRASYFTPGQMAGQMFNRETSILGLRRFLQVHPIEQQYKACLVINAMAGSSDACWLGDAGLSHLCTPIPSVKPPDYFVVPFKQGVPIAEWTLDERGNEGRTTFRLYRCKDFTETAIKQRGGKAPGATTAAT